MNCVQNMYWVNGRARILNEIDSAFECGYFWLYFTVRLFVFHFNQINRYRWWWKANNDRNTKKRKEGKEQRNYDCIVHGTWSVIYQISTFWILVENILLIECSRMKVKIIKNHLMAVEHILLLTSIFGRYAKLN